MRDSIKLEIEVSLDDFFNSEQERSDVFRDAMESAIIGQLSKHEFIEKNIAYHVFRQIKEEVFQEKYDAIKEAIRASIEEHKRPDRSSIIYNDIYQEILNETLQEFKPEIKERAQSVATKFMEDDSTEYGSFYDRVASACVDKVYDLFVETMVKARQS